MIESHHSKEKDGLDKSIKLAEKPLHLDRYRNERNLMLYPFCSTAKRKRTNDINYKSADGRRWLTVMAPSTVGIAKIWDFDILRFALSKAGQISRIHDCVFPPYVDFTAYECLKALGRGTDDKSYKWLLDALKRLALTGYCGNIFRDDDKEEHTFTLISVTQNPHSDKIRIEFNSRLIESARYMRGLLEIKPEVINEESGLKKRLLELVDTSMGDSKQWRVGIHRLQEMCAHEGEIKEFKRTLKEISLPWNVLFETGVEDENVIFYRKDSVV